MSRIFRKLVEPESDRPVPSLRLLGPPDSSTDEGSYSTFHKVSAFEISLVLVMAASLGIFQYLRHSPTGPIAPNTIDSELVSVIHTNHLAAQAYYSGNIEVAESSLRSLVTVRPGDSTLWANFAILLHHRGKLKEAAEAFEKSLALNPAEFAALNGLGALKLDLHDNTSARDYLTLALSSADVRHTGEALLNLGKLNESEGQWKEAVAIYTRFLGEPNADSMLKEIIVRRISKIKQGVQ